MNLIALSNLFSIEYGHGLSLNKLTPSPNGVAFVGRSARNNGVTGRVRMVPNLAPNPAGTLTVAVSGSVLETFVQTEPYYTAFHVLCLTPKVPMTDAEKLFYAAAIRANRYRYNYGRQANRTLKDLQVPAMSEVPTWVEDAEPDMFDGKDAAAQPASLTLDPSTWAPFYLGDLFEMKKGKRLTKAKIRPGHIPFIGAIDKNNGVRQTISNTTYVHEAGTITVNYNGSVGEAFYQPRAFWASDDVNVLYPKFEMTPAAALFICTVIRMEKYRYNYGRKWHLERMKESAIKLPVDATGEPDVAYMEAFINSLPLSSQID